MYTNFRSHVLGAIMCVLFVLPLSAAESPQQGNSQNLTVEKIKGDVNSDGVVNDLDIELIQNIILGILDPTPDEFWAADCNDDGIIDILDVQCAINIFRENAKLIVLKPNGGECWGIHTTYTIRWDTSIVAKEVNIEFSNDAGTTWSVLVDSTENDGHEQWTPLMGNVSDSCLIRISHIWGSDISAQSEAMFQVSLFNSAIKGDVDFDCQIDSSDVHEVADIVLGAETSSTEFWAADVNSDGEINILDVQQIVNWSTGYEDWNPTITFISPNTSTNWVVGQTDAILWTSDLISDSTDLVVEISTDLGATWTAILDSTLNDGGEAWTPTSELASDYCLMRISTASCCGIIAQSVQFSILPPASAIMLYPNSDKSTCAPGEEFWLDIIVGTPDNPVQDLFGISFELSYLNQFATYNSGVTCDFLGNDLISNFTNDTGNGIVSVGLSRKSGAGGVSGYGCVARLKFTINEDALDDTTCCFNLSDVLAINSNGAAIDLYPKPYCIDIQQCIECWPGDNNSDGIVDQKDILPLGLFWHLEGPGCTCRQQAPFVWTPCCCLPWEPVSATCVDANGDGVIDEKDVLPIGFFWHKSHSFAAANQTTPTLLSKTTSDSIGCYIKIDCEKKPGEECEAIVYVHEIKNLFGISFELSFMPAEIVEIISVEPDSFLGSDIIFFHNTDTETATISVGATRKAGQGNVSGTGRIAKIKFKIADDATSTESITFHFVDMSANDEEGNPITLHVTTDVKNNEQEHRSLPREFALYQNFPNPFNPSTTIRFDLPEAGQVKLTIYNINGQLVERLVDAGMEAGQHEITWEAIDQPSGLYLCRMVAESGFQSTKRMILMK